MLWSAVCLALSCCFLFHRWYTYRYSHWADLGVQGPSPRFPYGNLKSSLLMRSTIGEEFEKIYRDYPSKGIVGIYKLGQPMLLVRDPQVVGDVLVRQFGRFRDNDYYVNGANDPITSLNPFFVQGPR
ncbi:hypothetical protein AAG570_005808 [Ranatra chinensis]|uniref:Cytochrome P450 n=1 Tax=Ranatra chinensis TaxID=642074 RepID=A0ABD0YB97_9HEMI